MKPNRIPRPARAPLRVLLLVAVYLGGVAGVAVAGEAPPAAWDEPFLGDPAAPVTIVEYFSFSCPHCARFHRETLPALRRDYIETGKVRLVLRDFPLNLAALAAARFARCGGPDRYLEIVDLFWRRWDDWIDARDVEPALRATLGGAGYDAEEFDRCARAPAIEETILRSHLRASRDFGVERTPTFLINGRKYVGFLPYGRLAAILEPFFR